MYTGMTFTYRDLEVTGSLHTDNKNIKKNETTYMN